MSTLNFDVFWKDHGAQRGMQRLGVTADQTHAKFGKINTGFSQLGGLAKAGGIAAAAGLAIGAGAAIKYGLDVASANEQAKIGFTTMLGSAQKAEKFLVQLQRFAAKTPFEFPELQQAASKLIAVGVSAKNVIPIMKTIGNVTSGMGTGAEGVQRAVVALQQMSAAGRITAEDLNQLRDAGIPLNAIFDAIGKATGKSSEEIAKMSRSGELGRKELNALMDALESGRGFEKFDGLMAKQSKSLAGMLSTLKDTFGQGMAGALEAGLPFLKQGIGVATNALSRFFNWIQTHQEDTVNAIVGIGDAFFGIGEAVLEFATVSLRAIGKVSNAMAGFFGSLSHLPFIGKGFREAAEGLRSVGPAAEDAAADLEGKLIPKIKSAHSAWDKFGKDQKAGAALRDSIMKVKNAHDAANRSIKENGKTLDSNTQKGRNNREALKNMADASRRLRERLVDQHASTKRLNRADDDARASFIKTAMRMGESRKSAEKLADKFGVLDRKINGLNSKSVNIKFSTNAFSVAGTKFKVNLSAPRSYGATGGLVKGPGTGTSDSVPYMLSNGEFIVRASETKKHRQLLEAINSGKERHMASGGYVDIKSNGFPNYAMGIPPAAQSYTNRFAAGAGNQLGKALAKGIENSFVGPGGGITGAAGGRVRYKGGTFTRLFARNLELIQRAAHVSMRVFQGGFRPRTSYSGTSHAGDAVDFQVNYALGRAFRKYVGAAGDRTGLGNWSPHIHAVPSPSHGRAGGSAIWQYRDYVRRGGARQSMRSPWGLSRGGTMVNPSTARLSEFGPEKVLTPAQTRSFDRMVRVMDSSGGAANTYITINAPNYVGSRDELRQTLVDMNRRGQLEVIKR